MTIDLELTKTIANIITINAQSQALKYNKTVNEIYTPQNILDLAKLISSGQINNQGLTMVLEKLAKNNSTSNQNTINSSQDSEVPVFDSPFGHFDSAMDFQDAENSSEQRVLTKVESVDEIVKKLNLVQTTNKDDLGKIVDAVIIEFPAQVGQYREGKVQILGFLIGQCMKQSKGQGNPKVFGELLTEKLA